MGKKKEGNKFITLLSLVLMSASIIYSITLFLQGKREQAIFVGLWPPTFVTLGNLLKQATSKDA